MESSKQINDLLKSNSELRQNNSEARVELAKKILNSCAITNEEISTKWFRIEEAALIWLKSMEEQSK